jgi:hypothetical protein
MKKLLESFEKFINEADDRCTRIAKRKYDVWPSAYASGAVVRCRKGEIWKDLKEEELDNISDEEAEMDFEDLEDKDIDNDGDVDSSDSYLHKRLGTVAKMTEEEELEEKKKTDYSKEKESGLHGWFSRQGGKGKSSGWVDCNTCRKDPKTGRKKCKSCGREKGEKRAKYPSCRPTPSDCGTPGKGKKWGKKSEAMLDGLADAVIKEMQGKLFQPGLKHHVENGIPLTENIYRVGSECYFKVIKQGRDFYKAGLYEALNEEEVDLFENTELGEWAMFEGESVPLDFPMYEESLEEAEYKGKKVELGNPTTGDVKKYKVYVRDPKTGNVKKVNYGDKKGGLKGNWNDPEARASFAARHNCEDKKDRTKAGYWACRAHKDFGKNVPGRFW